jgi:hypothetical protein
MESVLRVKHIGRSFRVTRTDSGLWIEVLDPDAEPLSLDRWDLAELGLVFEEDAEMAERQEVRHDPRLIEVLSELGIHEAAPPVHHEPDEDDDEDERSDAEASEWLVNDRSLVDN